MRPALAKAAAAVADHGGQRPQPAPGIKCRFEGTGSQTRNIILLVLPGIDFTTGIMLAVLRRLTVHKRRARNGLRWGCPFLTAFKVGGCRIGSR